MAAHYARLLHLHGRALSSGGQRSTHSAEKVRVQVCVLLSAFVRSPFPVPVPVPVAVPVPVWPQKGGASAGSPGRDIHAARRAQHRLGASARDRSGGHAALLRRGAGHSHGLLPALCVILRAAQQARGAAYRGANALQPLRVPRALPLQHQQPAVGARAPAAPHTLHVCGRAIAASLHAPVLRAARGVAPPAVSLDEGCGSRLHRGVVGSVVLRSPRS